MVKLGEVATYINGKAFKPEQWGTEGLPIIRIENLNKSGAYFNYYNGDLEEKYLVKNGDLLVSWSASLDAFIWDRGDAALNQHIFKVMENPEIVDRLYLFLALKEVMQEIRDQTHGATMKHINKPEFEAFEIPLPPLPEQKRIANILTERLAAVERACKASEARLEAARALPAAYLREVFESEEARVWKKQPLGELVSEFRYGTSNKSAKSGYLTLRIPNIIGNDITLENLVYVPVRDEEVNRLRLNDGDMLFVRTNGSPEYIARSAVFRKSKFINAGIDPEQIIYASYLIRARLISSKLNPLFLESYLRTQEGREAILGKCKTTAGQYNINTQGLGSLEIPVPSIEIQDKIVDMLGSKFGKQLIVVEITEQAQEAVEALPVSLLRQAFSGAL